MKESFNSSNQPNQETIKIPSIDRDGNEGAMTEWEVSHGSGDMVYLKQYTDASDTAKFIYRGMSRARFAELGGVITDRLEAATIDDAMVTMTDATAKLVADANEIFKQGREDLKKADENLENIKAHIKEETQSIKDAKAEQEANRPFTKKNARALLSYADIYGEQEANSEAMRTNPSAVAYTNELVDLSKEHGQDGVLGLYREINADYKNAISKLNFERSSTSVESSKSWAIWDIAKQSYMAKHPEYSSENYTLADPFDPAHRADKIREISSRHIGWEFEEAMKFAGNKAIAELNGEDRSTAEAQEKNSNAQYEFINKLTSEETRDRIMEIYSANRYPLPSHALAKLGELLRSEVEDDESESVESEQGKAGKGDANPEEENGLRANLTKMRESLQSIGSDKSMTIEQRTEALKERLDQYFDEIIKHDISAYPDVKGNRSSHGIPYYIPDGFMDLGITPKQNPADRGNIPIKYVDKRAILDKYKDVFVDVYQKAPSHKSQAKQDRFATNLVSRRVLDSMPMRSREDNQKLEAIQPLSALETAHSDERALVAQVIFQALGIESRTARTVTAFKKEIEEKGIENVVGAKRAINFVKFGDDWHIVDVSHPAHTRNWKSAIYKIDSEPEEPKSPKPSDGQAFIVGEDKWPRKYTTLRNTFWTVKRIK